MEPKYLKFITVPSNSGKLTLPRTGVNKYSLCKVLQKLQMVVDDMLRNRKPLHTAWDKLGRLG